MFVGAGQDLRKQIPERAKIPEGSLRSRLDASVLVAARGCGGQDPPVAVADVIRERLRDSFALYDEFAAALPEASLGSKLPGLSSNAIGDQLWCVVGARESFALAIQAGEWSGFSCSLTAAETREREALRAAVGRSGEGVLDAIADLDSDDDDRWRFVLRLLEHEAAHQGQLIRYLYGLRLPIPAGWKKRYALD